MNKIILSGAERTVIAGLGHPMYTAEFVENWINKSFSVQSYAAKGFYEAVKLMAVDKLKAPPPDDWRPEA